MQLSRRRSSAIKRAMTSKNKLSQKSNKTQSLASHFPNISTVISIAGFIIAAFTMYWNLLDERFDLSLSIPRLDPEFRESDDGTAFLGKETYVFLNGGNRPVAVQNLQLVLTLDEPPDELAGSDRMLVMAPWNVKFAAFERFRSIKVEERCTGGMNGIRLTTDRFAPFIIKPGEIEPRNFEFRASRTSVYPKRNALITTCLIVETLTAKYGFQTRQIAAQAHVNFVNNTDRRYAIASDAFSIRAENLFRILESPNLFGRFFGMLHIAQPKTKPQAEFKP